MSADKMPPLPRGWVVVSGYEECGRFADDFPGTRADCFAKFKAGKPCERCPSNSSGAEVLHAYARDYAAEQTRGLVEALEALLEGAESMLGACGCIRGDTPEDADTFTHDEWAEDFLTERATEARALIAKHKEQGK